MDWNFMDLFETLKALYIEPGVHSHSIHTGGSYMCSHSCPGAEWRKRGSRSAPNGPSDHKPNIHSHLYKAMWVKTDGAGYENANCLVIGQPAGPCSRP